MKAFAWIFVGVAGIFMVVGIGMIANQAKKLRTWDPVEATILSSRVQQHAGSSSSSGNRQPTYSPEITFRYQRDNRTIEASGATTLSASSSSSWAHNIVRRFPAGKVVTAWVDPENPARGFVVRQASFFPYFFILFPMIFAMVGILASSQFRTGATQPATAVKDAPGWFTIKPLQSLARQHTGAWRLAIGWFAVGGAAGGHFLWISEPPVERFGVISLCVYGAIGLIPLVIAIRRFLLTRLLSDAQVVVDKPALKPGDTITIAYRQPVRPDAVITGLSLGLRCRQMVRRRSGNKTSYSMATAYEEWVPVLKAPVARSNRALEATTTLTIPAEAIPSSPAGFKGYPKTSWMIIANLEIAGNPDYHSSFPVTVQGAE